MFLGHYAAAFAAKKIAPKTSLGILFLAAQLMDLIWPVFLLLGWESVKINPAAGKLNTLIFSHYPFTHSLPAVAAWSIILCSIYFGFRRDRRSALIAGGLVLSHWFLDLLVHQPDLPVFTDRSFLAGLGAWNSLALTLILEFGLFLLGLYLYLKHDRVKDNIGKSGFWSLAVFLIISYLASVWGPAPGNVKILAWTALAGWLFIPWAYWADRHRTAGAHSENIISLPAAAEKNAPLNP